MWQNVDIFQECEPQNVLIFLSHSWNIDVKLYALQNTKYGRSELNEILSKWFEFFSEISSYLHQFNIPGMMATFADKDRTFIKDKKSGRDTLYPFVSD